MTVLILAHRKIKNWLPVSTFRNYRPNVSLPIEGRFLIFSFLIICITATTIYLWSLYSVFQSGFTLREQEIFLDKLNRDIKLQEVKASNMETNLVKDSELMAGMEKVSSMRYIKTSSEVSYKP